MCGVSGDHPPTGVQGQRPCNAPQRKARKRSERQRRNAVRLQTQAAALQPSSGKHQSHRNKRAPSSANRYSRSSQPHHRHNATRNIRQPGIRPVRQRNSRPHHLKKGMGFLPSPNESLIGFLRTFDYSVLKRPSAASPMAVKKSSTYLVVLFLASSKS